MDDRDHLEALLTALPASPLGLRRDDCGDWRIQGRRGHIYRDGDGYLIVFVSGTARGWTFAKRQFTFCRVTQDRSCRGQKLYQQRNGRPAWRSRIQF